MPRSRMDSARQRSSLRDRAQYENRALLHLGTGSAHWSTRGNDGGSVAGSYRCPIAIAPSGSAFQHIAPMQHGAGTMAWRLLGARDVAPIDGAEEQAAAVRARGGVGARRAWRTEGCANSACVFVGRRGHVVVLAAPARRLGGYLGPHWFRSCPPRAPRALARPSPPHQTLTLLAALSPLARARSASTPTAARRPLSERRPRTSPSPRARATSRRSPRRATDTSATPEQRRAVTLALPSASAFAWSAPAPSPCLSRERAMSGKRWRSSPWTTGRLWSL